MATNLKNLSPDDAKAALKGLSASERASYVSDWSGASGHNAWVQDLTNLSSATTQAATGPVTTGNSELATLIVSRAGKRSLNMQAQVGVNLYNALTDNGIDLSEREVSLVGADLNGTQATGTTAVKPGRWHITVSQRVEGGNR